MKEKMTKEQMEVFELEQKINFGLNNKKISLKLLKKHWHKLRIDPLKKNYLSIFVNEETNLNR